MASTLDPAHLAFALRTHALLREQERDGDLLWSPYSVAAALAMVAAGAGGRTRDELAAYLAPGAGLDDLLERVRDAAVLDDDQGSGLTVVNTLWTRADLPVEAAYEGRLRGMPGGALRTADFGRDPGGAAAAINEDVAKTTRGLIRSIVDRQAVTGAQAVLVNALWVYLAWIERFTVAQTGPLAFHTPDGDRQVPAMRARRQMTYGRANGWGLVTLPGHGGLALDILLPERPLAETEPRPEDLARLYDRAGRADVRLALPRFEVAYGTELSAVIAALGAATVFTDRADLSGISPVPLEVDKVLHKARLRVDEAGAEGAAATAVGMRLASAVRPREPVEFTVDRPYLVVLRHLRTGLVYFLAEITAPRDPGPAAS